MRPLTTVRGRMRLGRRPGLSHEEAAVTEHVIEQYVTNGYTVKIMQDPDPSHADPRDADNLGLMVAEGHRRYTLGDRPFSSSIPEWDAAVAIIEEFAPDGAAIMERLTARFGATVVLPLYLLDHSGLAMRTGPFREDPGSWDSGIVGFIFDTARTREQCGTPDERIEEVLRSEVQTYDAFLQGEVYGYVVEAPDGEEVESCWGYVGELDYVRQEAVGVAEGLAAPQWVIVTGGIVDGVEQITGPYTDRDLADEHAVGEGGVVMLLHAPAAPGFPLTATVEEVAELLKPVGDAGVTRSE
jgi:hypothetical protein